MQSDLKRWAYTIFAAPPQMGARNICRMVTGRHDQTESNASILSLRVMKLGHTAFAPGQPLSTCFGTDIYILLPTGPDDLDHRHAGTGVESVLRCSRR